MQSGGPETRRIALVTLDRNSVGRRSPQVDHEIRSALYDLNEFNVFDPGDGLQGPFNLRLSVEDQRLVFDVRDAADQPLTVFSLSVRPFRKLIKDYFVLCESYYDAIKHLSPTRIEAIDMGRRGLHNEGASRLCDSLADKAHIDNDTARRLFTLLCALHLRL